MRASFFTGLLLPPLLSASGKGRGTGPARISILLLLFALLPGSAALAQGSSAASTVDSGPPIILRVGGAGNEFKIPDKNTTVPRYRADRAVVDAFEKANPNIHLENAVGLVLGGPAAESNLLLQFAAGAAPDVIYVNFRESSTYIEQGFLEPLDGYIQQDPGVWGRVNPAVQKVLNDVGHGHIYSIPYAQYVLALYWRKDIFEEAGLDPEKPPTTWDELYNDAEACTDQQKGVWGFEFDPDPGYWWCDFLWQAGGEVIKKDAAGRWHAAFNTPAGVSALEFYKKLLTAPWTRNGKTYYGVSHHSDDLATDEATGKVAMWFQYQSNVVANMANTTTTNPALIGIAPMPKGPTGITANELNASMWGISSQIKDPRVRAAAWKFVSFMGSDEADRIRTRAYVEAGLANTINPQSLLKYGYADFQTPQSKAWLEANQTLLQHGHPEPYGENMNQIYRLLDVPLLGYEYGHHLNPKALLDRAAVEVDNKLTGYVDPHEMAKRRVIAWIIFTLVFVVGGGFLVRQFAISLRQLIAAHSSPGAARIAGAQQPQLQTIAWIFMTPAILSIALWAYWPLCRGLVIAFENYRIVGTSTYVGLDNFIDVFYHDTFWFGLRTSILFTVYTLAFGFFLPIFLALGLSEIPLGKMFYRTMYYLPAVTSGLVIVFLWRSFEDSTQIGLFNTILNGISAGHIGPVKWLEDPNWALFSTVLPRIWASAGPGCIIYLAALKGVSEEMYEAADLDGAGIWTKIWRITIPTLKPLILINLVGATIGAFQASESMLVMTGGGPAYATHTLGLEIFYNAFLYLKFGYATACAWVMGSMLVGFTLYQLRMLKDLKFTAAGA